MENLETSEAFDVAPSHSVYVGTTATTADPFYPKTLEGQILHERAIHNDDTREASRLYAEYREKKDALDDLWLEYEKASAYSMKKLDVVQDLIDKTPEGIVLKRKHILRNALEHYENKNYANRDAHNKTYRYYGSEPRSKNEAERKLKLKIPVKCRVCGEMKLPRYMNCKFYPTMCKKCETKMRKAKENQKRLNATKGFVVVVYGKHPKPKTDGNDGYTYSYDQPLNLGDIVRVPNTWLRQSMGDNSSFQLATVVSTYSTYNGEVNSIIDVVE